MFKEEGEAIPGLAIPRSHSIVCELYEHIHYYTVYVQHWS